MTYLILGGSSGLGRALANKFASEGKELILVSQDKRDTEALASHLMLTHGTAVTALSLDLTIENLSYDIIEQALLRHSPLKGIVASVGLNDEKDEVGMTDQKIETITRANYLSPCKIINHFLTALSENSGVVIGFGSVATARGRRRNSGYSAAKCALESYFESLMHSTVGSPISVQFYVLGYLDTNLSFAETLIFPRANPEKLAEHAFKRQKKTEKRFYPTYWHVIYRVVQFLPWTIFKRLSF